MSITTPAQQRFRLSGRDSSAYRTAAKSWAEQVARAKSMSVEVKICDWGDVVEETVEAVAVAYREAGWVVDFVRAGAGGGYDPRDPRERPYTFWVWRMSGP